MSTPYTPQSNGIVERFMGYLKGALISLVNEKPKRWDQFLPVILFAYRITPHPELGDTLFFLNKGYNPQVPETVALNIPVRRVLTAEWHLFLTSARQALEDKILQQQQQLEQLQQQRGQQFHVGQLVLIKKTPQELQQAHTKITNVYNKVGRITTILPSQVAYEIQLLHSDAKVIINRTEAEAFL